jgi:histone H1/5
MSLEIALREMVRRELAEQLSPLQKAIGRMEKGLDALDALRALTAQIKPLANRIGSMAGLRTFEAVPAQRPPARRGRPPKAARKPEAVAPAPAAREEKKPRARAAADEGRACAVMGCGRPARSKGYCSAHYQKLRLLTKTNRRPTDWVDDARPNSVRDVKLPRGRAAAKAREEAPAPAAPATPPKPKAWVRKKGKAGMVSLN